VIHYPTPREAQEEAEAAERLAEASGMKKQNWIARAWKEFLRY
jgi:hypothetical protein